MIMPLLAGPLSKALEAIFQQKPPAAAAAAALWATAYLSYAASAMSSASSLPVAAAAGLPTLLGAFTGAFQKDQSASGAAGQIAQGVISFWSAQVWVGPTAAGVTTSPGNSSLASALGDIFGDTSDKTAAEKAQKIADAFDAGAKLVIVTDTPFVQPAPPIVGPIS
jgi:hypothetical protein